MPSYIVSGLNVQATGDSMVCRDTTRFFDTLATKLLDMSRAIQQKMDEIRAQVNCQEKGVLLASIEAPNMALSVKYLDIEYIKRYGPPEDGIFDEAKLIVLRGELGITNQFGLNPFTL